MKLPTINKALIVSTLRHLVAASFGVAGAVVAVKYGETTFGIVLGAIGVLSPTAARWFNKKDPAFGRAAAIPPVAVTSNPVVP